MKSNPRRHRPSLWALFVPAVGTALVATLPAQAANTVNPYRGDAIAIQAGSAHYAAHCARCHGTDASQPNPEAPDLRRLNSYCNRLKDGDLKAHCLSDVDTYFLMSAREGKVRAGIRYMPAWRDVLNEQIQWQIRSYIESQPLDPPKVKTSVDRASPQ